MVSPQKKKKLDINKDQEPGQSVKNNHNRKIKNTSKPLLGKKFYLDIRNHASLKKIENKLISLGAKLELFLIKEVNYVVTDREDYKIPKKNKSNDPTPSPLFFCSVSSGPTDSPTDGVNNFRARSRAETMLERVRNQPQKTNGDILDNALAWKIPIYPLQKFLTWLEKIVKQVEKLTGSEFLIGRGIRELKGIYLKVETSSRPEFRIFKTWPLIGIATSKTNQNNCNDSQRMTRKVNRTKEASSAPGGGNGFCEMCRSYYSNLDAHVASPLHTKLAHDSSNYTQLDSIIAQNNLGVGALRKSLRLAKSPTPIKPEMGGRQSATEAQPKPASSPKMNGHVTRSTVKNNLTLNPHVNLGSPVPLPPINCNGIELRSKKNSKTSEDDKTKIKKLSSPLPTLVKNSPSCSVEHNLRSRKSQVSDTKSPSSRLVPLLRAVPVVPKTISKTPTKPRSSSRGKSPAKITSPPQSRRAIKKRLSVEEKFIEDNKSYYKVEVLNSKLRSTDYFISQRQVEARVNGNGTNNNNQTKSPNDKVVVRFKKVRRSQLAVLSDEAESFMFGDPKKELEQQESDSDEYQESDHSEEIEPKRSSSRKSTDKSQNKSDEPDNEDLPLLTRIKQEVVENDENFEVTFSFEMGPRRDAWMDSYLRQVEGTEHYIPQYHIYPSVVLPYEAPRNKRKKFKSAGSRLQQLQSQVDDKPRKSPRCHASTLAIMSSLISRRRPQRECTDKPVNYDEESSLSETIESSTSSSSGGKKCLTDLLVTACAESKDYVTEALLDCDKKGEIDPLMFIGIDPSCAEEAQIITAKTGFDMSLDMLVSNYKHCSLDIEEKHPPNLKYFNNLRYANIDSCASSDCSEFLGFVEDKKTINKKKKRKRNMTGWPSESKHKRRPKDSSMNSMTDSVCTSPHLSSSQLIYPRKRGRPPKNFCPPMSSLASSPLSKRSEDNSSPRKKKYQGSSLIALNN